VSVLYYGGTLVANNEMTVGALTSFILYAAYTQGGTRSGYSWLNNILLGVAVKYILTFTRLCNVVM
jgi:ABC-type bacteriocin/lantibiotic exporter with double-glycine peptidase domain